MVGMGNMVKELQTKLEATWVEWLDIKRTSDKSQVAQNGGGPECEGWAWEGSSAGNIAAFRTTLWSR